MIESTRNFADALAIVQGELGHTMAAGDNDLIARLLKRKHAKQLAKAHRKVRALYANGKRVRGAIDWTKIIQWVRDNWQEVLKILLTFAPLLL